MNRGELRERVLEHQFSENRYITFINDTLNEAQRRIARRADLRIFFDTETVATTAGDASYTLPTDFARLYSLTYPTESIGLTSVTVPEYDELPVATSVGRPRFYTIDRPDLKLYPTPDAAYDLQLRFYRSPTAMTDDSDIPELPEDYHHILITYTLARCYRRENDYTATQFHQDQYEREFAEMVNDLQDDAQDATQAQQVPGMWSTNTPGIRVVRP